MCLDTTVYVTKSGWHCIVCEKWRLCCFSLPTCLARRRRRLWSLRNVPCSPITWATVMYLPSISPSHHPGCHTDIYHKPPYCGSDPGDIMRARWAFEGTSEWKQQIFFFFLKQNFVTSCCTFPFFDKGADTSNTLLEAGSLKQDAPKKKKKKRCSRHCVNWTWQGRSETLSKRRKILCQNTNSCTLSVYTWGNAFVVCRVGREEYAAELEIFWEIYLIFFLAMRCIKGCHPHVWTVNMKRQLAAALHSLTTGNR